LIVLNITILQFPSICLTFLLKFLPKSSS